MKLPANATTISSIVQWAKQSSSSPCELAVCLHNIVRDEVAFGFTQSFDTADAAYTLSRRRGHCTPKTELFVTLLRAAGFDDATVVAVSIPGTVLHHIGSKESSPFPPALQHTFTEVTVQDKLCRVDSYVVDQPLFDAAWRKLKVSDEVAGYGIHGEGTSEWDGRSDAFSQYVPSTHTRELEKRYPSTKLLLQAPDYLHAGLVRLLQVPSWDAYRVHG